MISSPDTIYLNLPQALQTALKHSPQTVEAGVARLQSWLALGQGANGVLPTPQVNITRTNETSSPELWTSTLTINQVVFDPTVFAAFIVGVINYRYYSLEAQEKVAGLIYQTTTDYLNLLKAQLILDAAHKALERTAENLKYATERYRLGQTTRIDLLQSEVFFSQAQLNLLNAKKGVALAQEKFRTTAGITITKPIRATEELLAPAEFPISDADSLLGVIEHTNPNVQISQSLNTIARLNLGVAFARILPSISFYRTWTTLDTALPKSYRIWKEKAVSTDGVRLSFSLVDIKSLFLNLGDAIAGSRRSRATLARNRFQLRAAVQSALFELEEAKLRYAEAKRNLELNQELYNLAQIQHRVGGISLTDLLEVEVNLAQAEASYLSALCDTYIQSAQIGYLLGKTDVSVWKQ
ncbi:MAG: TolC family protein [bacterium]